MSILFLLVGSFFASNVAADLIPTSNLSKGRSCDEKQCNDQIIFLESVFGRKPEEKRAFVVASNSELPANLIKKLTEEKYFTPVDLNKNLEDNAEKYKNMLTIESARVVKILIIADNIENIPHFFENFTKIFSNLSYDEKKAASLSFAVNYIEKLTKGEKKDNLKYIIRTSDRSEFSNLAKILNEKLDNYTIDQLSRKIKSKLINIMEEAYKVEPSIIAKTLIDAIKKNAIGQWRMKEVENKLEYIIEHSKSLETSSLAKFFLENPGRLYFLQNYQIHDPWIQKVDDILNNLHFSDEIERLPDVPIANFPISQYLQDSIFCLLTRLIDDTNPWDHIPNSWETKLQKYFSNLEKDYKVSDKLNEFEYNKRLLDEYESFRNITQKLKNTSNVHSFAKVLIESMEYYDIHFQNKISFRHKSRIIDYLIRKVSGDDLFASTAAEWSKPLEGFRLENPNELSGIYYMPDGKTEFVLRNFTRIYRKMKKGLKLLIRGSIVRLSDVMSYRSAGKIKYIELFATKEVLIDVDLNLSGKVVQVAIIAPKWKIIGSRIINLNGQDGEPFHKLKSRNGTKNGNKNGAHGMCGLPGGPAGSFYGIADIIINAGNLTILAQGGDGGPGQNGGNGAQGEDGESYAGRPSFDCSKGSAPGWAVKPSKRHSTKMSNTSYSVFGKQGAIGGRGGNGGLGGLGAKKGRVIIENFSDSNQESVTVSALNGKNGIGGIGGRSGIGGENGKMMNVECRYSNYAIQVLPAREAAQHTGRGPEGQVGIANTSHKMRRTPKKSLIVQNFPSTVNVYKLYARSNLRDLDPDQSHELAGFYDSLNRKKVIARWYDTLSLVEEFTGLELQYSRLHEKFKFNESLEALSDRIVYYAVSPTKEDERTKEYRNVVRDLYYDIIDKMKSIHIEKIYPVSTDIKSEFETLGVNSIQSLREPKSIDEILTWLDSHIRPVNEKIEEAQHMLSEDIHNSMDDLENTLDREIDVLLTETTILKKLASQRGRELVEKRQELEQNLRLKSMFGVLKVGCVALKFIHSTLRISGSIASSATSIIETSATESDPTTGTAEKPEYLQTTVTETEKYFKAEDAELQKIIKQQEIFVEQMKNKTSYDNVVLDVWKSTASLRRPQISVRERGVLMMKVYSRKETELINMLEDAKSKKNNTKTKSCEIGIKVAKYLKVTSQTFQTGSDVVIGIMKDVNKTEEIDLALKNIGKNYMEMENYKEKIYNVTRPILENIVESLDSNGKEMRNMNESHLLLTKWNMTNSIKTVQRTLMNMAEGFNVSEDFKWTMDKLLTTFDLMNDLNAQVLEYRKQKSEMRFATGLHISHNSYLEISDSHLRRALSGLQVALSYNRASAAYDKWICAFKQFAFPRAGLILKNFEWPEIFVNNDTYHVIHDIERNINEFDKHMYHQRKFDFFHLENMETQRFMGRNSEAGRAFSVWDKEHYSNEINDILSGKKIKLAAMINNRTSLDALKFNFVDILFSSEDPIMNEEIDRHLKYFRVELTHHGDSYYKCNNSVYLMKNTPSILRYSFLKDQNGERDYQTEYYLKITHGEFMLSPYATWSIKLEAEDSSYFEILLKYKNKVDIELVGQGQFSANTNVECDYTIDNYYTKVGSIVD